MLKKITTVCIALAIPLLIYAAHAMLFRHWIMDDAGISFSYSRSLALGYGLVPQPGAPRVEGFSNFLWVLLLAPFFTAGAFDPLITPKLLGFALVAGSFGLIYLIGQSFFPRFMPWTILALCLTAVNTSFVVWTTSGLENSLYAFLVLSLLWLVLQVARSQWQPYGHAVVAGLVTSAVSLTRPDGVMFAALYPLVSFANIIRRRDHDKLQSFCKIAVYCVVFALCFGSFLVFRLAYFGELFPNTYHAKGYSTLGPDSAKSTVVGLITLNVEMISKLHELLESVAGPFGNPLACVLLGLTGFVIGKGEQSFEYGIVLIFLSCTVVIYLVLPKDWMREFRFATAFFPLFYCYLAWLMAAFLESISINYRILVITIILTWLAFVLWLTPNGSWGRFPLGWYLIILSLGGVAVRIVTGPREIQTLTYRFLVVALVTLFLTQSATCYSYRSREFAETPPTNFFYIARIAHDLEEFACRTGIRDGSLLYSDLGGTLFYSRLRIYDLAGLCDRTIARTYAKDWKATREFYDYVFDTIKPSIILVGGFFALCRLDDDARFRRDYLAVHENVDEWVKTKTGSVVNAGLYVRKDSIPNQGNFTHNKDHGLGGSSLIAK